MAVSFLVPARFCGPPRSGNGGYTCGMVAREFSGAVECTLRKPVPLETSLQIERRGDGVVLLHGDEVILEAVPTTLDIHPPDPISPELVAKAVTRSEALSPVHPFPSCFVCGPLRKETDGLRIFPGPTDDGGKLFAASWGPAVEFADRTGAVEPQFVWAAMDCPTGFAGGFPAAGKLVTGRLAVQQLNAVEAGVECQILSWPLGVEGRKHFSAACLYQHQRLCAVARATWIRLETTRLETTRPER